MNMLGAERAARSTICDKHVHRCSAWFGSVRFGFLAPEIFIRIKFWLGRIPTFTVGRLICNNKRGFRRSKHLAFVKMMMCAFIF